MGGQACVFYGAAEFSRDCDIVIATDDENLVRLNAALTALEAECIAVPPYERQYLERGHAVHFRCQHPDAARIRLDVMARMRGCDSFTEMWERRLSLEDVDGIAYEILGIEDLVKAKKTQRDKDWPMIRRLVDSHYEEFKGSPSEEQIRFWLRESRTPEVLISLAAAYPAMFSEVLRHRPLLVEALTASRTAVQQALAKEESLERDADAAFWRPLRQELEKLRFEKRNQANE